MNKNSPAFYLKTNRIFNNFKKISWTIVPVIAIGGLFYPKLGLLLIPIMLTIMTLGFFKGKYWCGNLCPHGSLFDFILLPLSPNRRIPGLITSTTLKVLFFLWYMGMFTWRVVKVSQLWGTLTFYDKLGFVFTMNYLVPTIIGTTLALFVNPRSWCNFCPMGTIEQLFYKLGKVTGLNRKTDEKVTTAALELCHKCGKCARVCPMQLKPYLEFSQDNQLDNENCIRCTTCIANCPAGILSLANAERAQQLNQGVNKLGYEGRRRMVGIVESIKPLTGDVNEYTFKLLQPEKANYTAGQFILVKILDDPEMFRAYSISSSHKDRTRLSVTIKKLKDGFGSGLIFGGFKVGDKVELEGPLGRELIVDKNAPKVLLVAGGIGITPFVPMVRDLLETRNSVEHITLIYGVNKEEEFIYDDYFKTLAACHPKFTYLPTVAFPGESWKDHRGFVTDVMKDMELKGYKVYMCGPKPMVNATIKVLKTKGLDERNVFAESA
ncbi:MAG: flavodoxin reductase family protein [Peptococcaceae bacterium]|jgi:NAD(P)H-flavin reductase/formate hydrogenlyase subunit 6/NADH:ubiquinone oxidoreductase subunit I|nr:flavodoxin reductase family protein [Peptococcaceae bacterium]